MSRALFPKSSAGSRGTVCRGGVRGNVLESTDSMGVGFRWSGGGIEDDGGRDFGVSGEGDCESRKDCDPGDVVSGNDNDCGRPRFVGETFGYGGEREYSGIEDHRCRSISL
jgi:hypothetical protein